MYHFIVNPNSRSGRGRIVWNELEPILKSKQVSYHVYFTKYQKHATAIAAQITSDDSQHIIIALGGDGTVNEVVNGIQNYEKNIFAYIPIGSSNDFARSLKLPTEPAEALHNILTHKYICPINVGALHYQNKIRLFAGSSGMGFDAAVCHEAVVSPFKRTLNKLKLGKLTYAAIALHRLLVTTPQELTITIDGMEKHSFSSAYFISVMNTTYEGGGLKFCPYAQIDDDKLDIIVVSDMPKLKILALLPTAFFGLHRFFKGVHLYTCHDVSIETVKPLPVHTDGEPIFLQRRMTVSCLPEKLRIIAAGSK